MPGLFLDHTAFGMDPAVLDRGIDLSQILYDQAVQYAVIRQGMLDLRAGDTVAATNWLGNPPPFRRRKSAGGRSATRCRTLCREPAETPTPPRVCGACRRGRGAAGPTKRRNTPLLDLARAFLLVSDKLRRLVLHGPRCRAML